MKVFARPISSPGRPTPDDLPIIPPPLITFPRTRSKRGSRSRANPMFVAKINTANDANLEPSSPKVTCIGQVKIRRRSRSNDNNNKQKTTTTTTTAFRRWLRKLKPRCFRRVWRRTLSFLRCGYGGKSRKLQESERRRSLSLLRCDYGGKSKKLQESERIDEANNNQKKNEHLKREIEDAIIPDVDNSVLISASPPRNAFLLTRSRSAPPCRSSSFPSKNWEKSGAERDGDEVGKKLAGNIGIEEGTEAIDGEFAIGTGECEGSINGECEGFKGKKPLSLSRCKSVPGRTGDKHFSSFGS